MTRRTTTFSPSADTSSERNSRVSYGGQKFGAGAAYGSRQAGSPEEVALLSRWPMPCPSRWVEEVNRPQTQAELAALRRSVERGRPFGGERWVQKTAASLGLETTLRPRGRPKNRSTPPDKVPDTFIFLAKDTYRGEVSARPAAGRLGGVGVVSCSAQIQCSFWTADYSGDL